MKKRLVSILAVLTLCLTLLPVAGFAAHPLDGYAEGDKVSMEGREYTYLGDITETGMELNSFRVEGEYAEYGPAGIAKAGEGYLSYRVEDGIAYITLKDASITSLSEEAFAGYGIEVSDYDVVIHGIGTNSIEASGQAIHVAGCLTINGQIEKISGGEGGICTSTVVGFGEDEATLLMDAEVVINGTIGGIYSAGSTALHADGNLFINGSIGEIYGAEGMNVGAGYTGDEVREHALVINGAVGDVTGTVGAAISVCGDLTIAEKATVGKLFGNNYGIFVRCHMDDKGEVPLTFSNVAIHGTVGDIVSIDLTDTSEDEWLFIHYGVLVEGGDLVISGTVDSILATDYGVWMEGGQFRGEENITGGIVSEVPVTVREWPSAWAHAEVMDAIMWSLVPEELQGQYTQATTRAEYAALATCLYESVTGGPIELTEEEKAPFTDTADLNVAKMYKMGVVNGMGDGTFAPNAKLTREQAATMLSRLAAALDKPLAAGEPAFADNASISDWAFAAVGQVQAVEIMKGVEDNLFAPQRDYTREQSILTMDRLFHLVAWDNEEE